MLLPLLSSSRQDHQRKSLKNSSNNILIYPIQHSITEAMPNPNQKETKIHSKLFESIHHYSKYGYQLPNKSDNDEQIIETDSENCPLEDIFSYRFIQ